MGGGNGFEVQQCGDSRDALIDGWHQLPSAVQWPLMPARGVDSISSRAGPPLAGKRMTLTLPAGPTLQAACRDFTP